MLRIFPPRFLPRSAGFAVGFCLSMLLGLFPFDRLVLGAEPQAERFVRSVRVMSLSHAQAQSAGQEQQVPEEKQDQQKPPHFKSSTYAGLLEIRVRRPDGSLVWSLKREDFQVKDGKRARPIVLFQPPREVPISAAFLFDLGMAVDAKTVSESRELVFQLIHLLEPSDEILLGTFTDRVGRQKSNEGPNGEPIPGIPKHKEEVEFLTGLTSDRTELSEMLWNISPTGRASKWSQLGQIAAGGVQLGNESRMGLAVDEALLKLKGGKHTNRVILVLSSSFGNIGPGTLDHLEIAGTRLFVVLTGGRSFAETINLGGNQKSGLEVVESSGGLAFAAEKVKSRIQELRDALKKYYLLAYEADADTKGDAEITIKGHPEYSVHHAPRTSSTSSFY